MTDMRAIFAVILIILLLLRLLCAKAFAFSMGWILWPLGAIALVGFLILFVLSLRNVQ